jgi:hypothetical protein
MTEAAGNGDSQPLVAPAARQRRRSPHVVPRPHAVFARLSDDEFDLVRIAAAGAGLTTTGYVAQMAVEVARGTVKPLPTSIGAVVRELIDATTQLRRYGVLLNQAVAKLNATGEAPVALPGAIERCDVAVAAVRDAVVRLASTR